MIKWRHTSITALKRGFKVFHIINSLTQTILKRSSRMFHTTTGRRARTLHEQLFFFTLALFILFVKTSFKDLEECLCYNFCVLSFGAGTFSWLVTLLRCAFASAALLSSLSLFSSGFLLTSSWNSCFLSWVFLSSDLRLFLSSRGMVWPLTSLKSAGSVWVSLSAHEDSVI